MIRYDGVTAIRTEGTGVLCLTYLHIHSRSLPQVHEHYVVNTVRF